MATITGTGVGSGLDVNSIVTSLMAVEKRPLQLLQTQASTLQSKISAFGSLKGQIASLADVATRLANPANWSPMQADTSDGSSVAVTAGATATAGSHSLTVQQLAQSQVLASAPYAASTTAVGTGTITLELGTTAAGVFTAKSGTTPVAITIDSSNQTLAGVRDAINNAKAGVTASIINDPGGARLVLRGADGAANSVRLTVADGDGNDTDAAGLSAIAFDPAAGAGAGRNLTQTQAAQDAKFTLDGVALTNDTNTAATALDGVTFTLKQVTTQPVSIGISVQAMAVRKNVNDFVNAYNALNSLLASQTKADPSGKARGALQADSTAVGALNALRSMLHGSVTGLAGANTLNAAGIVLQRDGSLSTDETRLAPLLSNPDQLAKLFSQPQTGTDATTGGFGVRFKAWASSLTADSGLIGSRLDGLQKSVTSNQKLQDSQQDRLDRTEARIRKQYQALDSQMNTLNAQMAKMKSALGLA